MGGIGAHCMEDFRTLQMFVEAPSMYKEPSIPGNKLTGHADVFVQAPSSAPCRLQGRSWHNDLPWFSVPLLQSR